MHRWLFDLLICPDCPGDWSGDAVDNGLLGCAGCGASWPVRNGVPRFVTVYKDYAGGFGFHWQRWSHTQIDRLNGTTLTTDRLLTDTGWDRDRVAGKLTFDGGAGAGRFSNALACLGARVLSSIPLIGNAPCGRCRGF